MREATARAGWCIFCTYRFPPSRVHLLPREFTSTYSKRTQEGLLARNAISKPRFREVDTTTGKPPVRIRKSYEHREPPTSLSAAKLRHGRSNIADRILATITRERLRRMSLRIDDRSFMVQTGLVAETAEVKYQSFENTYREALEVLGARRTSRDEVETPHILQGLRSAFVENSVLGIDAQLKFALQGFLANERFTQSDLLNQARLADLRYPYEWYPKARFLERKIHLHVGPTNSGKTYHALKRLESATSGIYAGPLRLLAHEVYSRLNALGKPCNLVTGDERIVVNSEKVDLVSCTVEMVPVSKPVEVAVVDEIQMIAHEQRGWAWAQALLGIQAKELHLCGEERVVPLIRALTAAMGDQLEIHNYQRLNPLKTMSTSLNGDLTKLRKGDCLVSFSRLQIHALRMEIEKVTGRKVAVVYGSLPPEIRAQQAKLFNDPTNDYDFLVASDAIGMGLNLSIKRIVFESLIRFDGAVLRTLGISDIKQIGGRAGRYRIAADAQTKAGDEIISEGSAPRTGRVPSTNIGLITTLEEIDLPIVQRAMQIEAKPIKSVAIQPPDFVIIRFSQYFPPETPFSYILLRLYEMSRIHPRFQLCDLTHIIAIADVIEPIRNLSIADRISICAGPAVGRDEQSSAVTFAMAKCIADQSGGGLLDIPEIPIETLDLPITTDKEYLQKLETLHKSLVLYLWLSYRFTGVFISQDMAFHVKRMVEERMDKVLTEQSKKRDTRTLMKKLREQAMLQSLREQWQHYKIGEDGLVPRTPNVVDDGGSVLAHTFGGGNTRSIGQNVHT